MAYQPQSDSSPRGSPSFGGGGGGGGDKTWLIIIAVISVISWACSGWWGVHFNGDAVAVILSILSLIVGSCILYLMIYHVTMALKAGTGCQCEWCLPQLEPQTLCCHVTATICILIIMIIAIIKWGAFWIGVTLVCECAIVFIAWKGPMAGQYGSSPILTC
eukprot:TRINITY_DN6897_c0_g1_i1.p2 TRINITY_DN6897_c0_g1~~TRINITY_DN6897_c0_g1_i1.p2  ORF type:complete len:189 (+),score=58.96 TRINITY_DN6897_c0_g1_i1:85-567(+)